ncbi:MULTISPECIES: HlyD family efflux transporter periplasmic adaptor subunit [unclassified Pseudomonas]|uniref:HlyD family secretion protein n=1 Tax=unclassified Pseudomonas TaxID=196821 RepID=UPI002448B3CD|nr:MULTISPECIES: HlyD family efflux transporter periplasmic adaptor subunit [unclassified Pseudomonas]MDG9928631.1 HlyD family efflux transporter periplasmic adaptor subunit [Pseudomonas sp. GD04042]MDH0484922.1 HlyD family efflux transporter periplasmic adaptor subunit [Pseudomonas sp. GD04015]MDH0606913.1 HlyD family efflux transporter periplasmic adaptor subunit [Pseudomonas sp. GD03869]
MHRLLLSSLLLACLAGCDAGGEQLLGTLEWDRVGLPAEASETVLSWQVAEGDRVEAGQLLLELDPRRQDARIAQARGEVQQAAARLAELSNGARSETIDSARASLARSRAEQVDAERNFTRIAELHRRKMVAVAELDRARATRDQAGAASRSAEAQLRELTNGTRPEQLEQAAAALDSARAGLAQLEVGREHLSLRAPRAGMVDALPFKVGDRPPAGAEVASLLVGEAPYARVFVPADIRAQVRVGDRLRVFVEGIEQPFQARVRNIRSEASFTPYYALTGDDASRLMYRAELLLEGEAARRLPAGLPLHAERLADERRQ